MRLLTRLYGICETKVPMQELELKMEGGLMREGGGVIAGFYGTCIVRMVGGYPRGGGGGECPPLPK